MKKFIYISIGLIALVGLVLLFTGGILVYFGPGYRYDREFETTREGEGFIPADFHLVHNYSEIPVIPVVLHIYQSKLPKDLNISKYDISYLRTHEGFERFKVNELSLLYDNGKIATLISGEHPEVGRTFTITENWQDALILRNAVHEKSSFRYRLTGESYTQDGTAFPFRYEVRYNYFFRFWITTRFLKWAGV